MTYRTATLAALLAATLALPCAAQTRCADFVPGPKPQNASRDFVGQDLEQIQQRGFITIAVYDDFRPFSWLEGETPTGVDVEVGKIIAGALGVEPRFVMVEAGGESGCRPALSRLAGRSGGPPGVERDDACAL